MGIKSEIIIFNIIMKHLTEPSQILNIRAYTESSRNLDDDLFYS